MIQQEPHGVLQPTSDYYLHSHSSLQIPLQVVRMQDKDSAHIELTSSWVLNHPSPSFFGYLHLILHRAELLAVSCVRYLDREDRLSSYSSLFLFLQNPWVDGFAQLQ